MTATLNPHSALIYVMVVVSALVDPPLSGPGRRQYVRSLSFYLDAIPEAREGRADVEAIRRTYPNWTEEQLRLRAEWLHTCDDTAIEKSLRGINVY